ncbi:MAG: proline--tRNA ligase, partial [Clostridiales bacterium]|nr:proline--tRNA ligase [Clostridiales bacterium]
SLWEESGRYESVGKELLRFIDRNGNKMVLGMTHEEAAVQLVREYGQSYQRYPFAVYQIQTKFRDEARPRGGLIRVREFTMKDAYSFHTTQADLEKHYWRYHEAYERIYQRAGLEVVSVASDAGMMGGNVSHEFMYLTPIGEDSIALCTACDYRANVEAAENIIENDAAQGKAEANLEKVHTPGFTTIEEISGFLSVTPKDTCKAVVYQSVSKGEYILVFMRGDMEMNETKLTNLLGDEIHPIELDETSDLVAGFIGPVGLKTTAKVLYDVSLKGTKNLVCGANQTDYHYTGFSIDRDVEKVSYEDLTKVQKGSICPQCGQKTIDISRGIEVGNIFQLGNKYTVSMDMTYLDEEGKAHYPVVGCYGIGVGRLAASVLEAHHDENGPIWPVSIAPWQVEICCLRGDEPGVQEVADQLYKDLQEQGIEVLFDDRPVSAGVMFSDADLFGLPLRLIVSPRNIKTQQVEVASRDKQFKEMVNLNDVVDFVKNKLQEM